MVAVEVTVEVGVYVSVNTATLGHWLGYGGYASVVPCDDQLK